MGPTKHCCQLLLVFLTIVISTTGDPLATRMAAGVDFTTGLITGTLVKHIASLKNLMIRFRDVIDPVVIPSYTQNNTLTLLNSTIQMVVQPASRTAISASLHFMINFEAYANFEAKLQLKVRTNVQSLYLI
jgi:hypothetical protein